VLPLLGAPGGRGRGESLQGKGFHERLGVTPETLRMLEDRGRLGARPADQGGHRALQRAEGDREGGIREGSQTTEEGER
jgi:hypothetical protein